MSLSSGNASARYIPASADCHLIPTYQVSAILMFVFRCLYLATFAIADFFLISGVVAGWIILLSILGSEAHGSHFEKGKAAFEEGGGLDVLDEGEPQTPHTQHDHDKEKGMIEEREEVEDRKVEVL